MGFQSSSLLCMAVLLACFSSIYAFDITSILSKYPKFQSLNNYLSETKLADEINSRNTITLLAVDDDGFSAIANKSPEAIKAIISTHVILDYFDSKKLVEAIGSKEQLTTLFQASGKAVNNQGFLTVSMVGEGEIAFGSAANGAPADDAEFVEPLTAEPYNISVIHVTKFIVAPGIDSQSKAPASAQTPAPSKDAKAPTTAATKSAKAPTPSETTDASTPSGAAESPVDASATNPSAAEGPAADDGAADTASAGSLSTAKMGVVGAVMAFASLFIVL